MAEAFRIQHRGLVPNSVGLYNRSKLTRLVGDQEWDKVVWEECWEKRTRQDKINTASRKEGTDSLEEKVQQVKEVNKKG